MLDSVEKPVFSHRFVLIRNASFCVAGSTTSLGLTPRHGSNPDNRRRGISYTGKTSYILALVSDTRHQEPVGLEYILCDFCIPVVG